MRAMGTLLVTTTLNAAVVARDLIIGRAAVVVIVGAITWIAFTRRWRL
jgi:hypothetical protein